MHKDINTKRERVGCGVGDDCALLQEAAWEKKRSLPGMYSPQYIRKAEERQMPVYGDKDILL